MRGNLIILIILTIYLISCSNLDLEGPYRVIKVIDGDTIILNNSERVRFSGINAPEVGECFYEEAKHRLEGLILNKDIFLERDRTDKDKYGRLLRYVYFNKSLVNLFLVQEGFVKVYHKYKSDTKRYEKLKEIEDESKLFNKGLWNCKKKENKCLYVRSKKTKIYHKPNCKWAKRIKPQNKVCYTKKEEVKELKPCKICM